MGTAHLVLPMRHSAVLPVGMELLPLVAAPLDSSQPHDHSTCTLYEAASWEVGPRLSICILLSNVLPRGLWSSLFLAAYALWAPGLVPAAALDAAPP